VHERLEREQREGERDADDRRGRLARRTGVVLERDVTARPTTTPYTP
jgi:hypothetical protein